LTSPILYYMLSQEEINLMASRGEPTLELFNAIKRVGYKICHKRWVNEDDRLGILWIAYVKALKNYDITRGSFALCYHYQALHDVQRHQQMFSHIVGLPAHAKGEDYKSICTVYPDVDENEMSLWYKLEGKQDGDKEVAEAVDKAVAQLSDYERELYLLFIDPDSTNELSQRETCEEWGVSHSTVSLHVSKVKKKLQNLLREYHE